MNATNLLAWLPAAPLALGLASPLDGGDHDTGSVAEAYVQANFQDRDLDRAGALLAEEALFVDPTAAVFGGPLAKGVRGRQSILDLQASWGVTDSAFDVQVGSSPGSTRCGRAAAASPSRTARA